jgi:hypothetical protein
VGAILVWACLFFWIYLGVFRGQIFVGMGVVG